MQKNHFLITHLSISLVVLVVLLCLVYLSFLVLPDLLANPQKYFSTDLPSEEIQFLIIQISFVVISVLVAYVVYLLFSYNTRAEIVAWSATKSLSSSLKQFEKLYEESPVPYMILNKNGEIDRPNKAALRFFGVVPNEINGKNLFYYQPTEDKEKTEKLIRYYKSNIPIDREEIRFITKEGLTKWTLFSVFKLNDLDGVRAGLATIFDITEQKKLEQAKTEFVSLASHQLRTPVATIKWYMDMLLSGSLGQLSDKQEEYLNRIHKVSEEMVDLVDMLLNISRIEAGSLKVESKSINVAELTESVLVELSAQIEQKRIIIEKQYHNHLNNVESDPKLLRIVIQNLISNAIKYTPEDGRVSISFKELETRPSSGV